MTRSAAYRLGEAEIPELAPCGARCTIDVLLPGWGADAGTEDINNGCI
jgi:hypothetical protein